MIKICFLSIGALANFEPESGKKIGIGGSETQLYLLATELARDKNFSVYFILDGRGNLKSKKYQGVFVQKTISSLPVVKKLFTIFQACLFLLKDRADIYISRGKGIENFFIVLIKKILNKKNIYMMAGDPKTDFLQNSLKEKVFLWSVKNSDLIVSQTQNQIDFLKNNLKKDGVLMNSVYPIEKDLKINDKLRNSILWVGDSRPIKKPYLFLNLVQMFPKEKFVMICGTNPKFPEEFSKIKNETNKIPNILFINYVPFAEIDGYFKRAKIFIHTSISEGFPNTFVQAAKNKTPVVSLNINPDNIFEKYKIGFCADGNFNKMIEYLKLLLENNELWQKMSENAYNYARENHDIKKIVENYKEIFRNLI